MLILSLIENLNRFVSSSSKCNVFELCYLRQLNCNNWIVLSKKLRKQVLHIFRYNMADRTILRGKIHRGSCHFKKSTNPIWSENEHIHYANWRATIFQAIGKNRSNRQVHKFGKSGHGLFKGQPTRIGETWTNLRNVNITKTSSHGTVNFPICYLQFYICRNPVRICRKIRTEFAKYIRRSKNENNIFLTIPT